MKREISITPEACRELFEAADYYDLESLGLGAEFLDVFDEALEQLADYPESSLGTP